MYTRDPASSIAFQPAPSHVVRSTWGGRRVRALCLALCAGLAAVPTLAASIPFYSSTDADPSTPGVDGWTVATHVGGADGQLSSFPTSGFVAASQISGRPGWMANNASGTNGYIGLWTFFVFRQAFDLTGYDPNTVSLTFRWGADDSGEGFADRGTWKPKFRLNGGALVDGTGGYYTLGPVVNLTSGFLPGENTIDFYVEGNGVTDGMTLASQALTAEVSHAVPEAPTVAMLGFGLVALLLARRRGGVVRARR